MERFAGTLADQTVGGKPERIGKVRDLLPEAMSVGEVLLDGVVREPIGLGLTGTHRVEDGLIAIAQTLPSYRPAPAQEDPVQDVRLLLTIVLGLIDEEERETVADRGHHARNPLHQVLCPHEHLVVAEVACLCGLPTHLLTGTACVGSCPNAFDLNIEAGCRYGERPAPTMTFLKGVLPFRR